MTIKRVLPAAAVACVLFVATRCDTVYDVTITINDAAAVRAFGCATDAGLLVQRLAGKPTTIVLDVMDMGSDVLSCRSSALIDYCRQKGHCRRIRRACYTVDFTASSSLNDMLLQAYTQLKAEDAGIAGLSTNETLLIRLVATAEQGCPTGALDPNLVAGCAYSCPTKLNASGTIDLDLDLPSESVCELAVDLCAVFGDVSP